MITKAEKVFLDKTVDEWINILENVGVPVGQLNFPEEAANDPQILENGLMVNMEHSVAGPYRTVGPVGPLIEGNGCQVAFPNASVVNT